MVVWIEAMAFLFSIKVCLASVRCNYCKMCFTTSHLEDDNIESSLTIIKYLKMAAHFCHPVYEEHYI
jgi:hypothetical protein